MSFLTFFFIYQTLIYYKNSISVGLGVFIFMLFYYNISFNVVRMVLSISIALFSYRFILEKQWWKFLFFACISLSVHNMAIVIIPFYYLYNKIADKNRYFRIAVYVLIAILVINHELILDFYINYIIRDTYYSHYLHNAESSFGLGIFLINMPFILPGLIFYKRLNKMDQRFKFVYCLFVTGFILKFVS